MSKSALLAVAVVACVYTDAACAQTAPSPQAPLPAGEPATDPAYQAAATGDDGIPLTPGMIIDLQHRYDQTQRATARVDDPAAFVAPVTRSVFVTLGPGGVTNIVQTMEGFPSAITFVDSTGEPWPIAWDLNSSPSSKGGTNGGSAAIRAVGLDVSVPLKGSNVLQISPLAQYSRGGVLVTLQGAPKPIAFMIVSGRGRYDADLTIRVGNRGPGAREQVLTRRDTPETGSPYLMAMLDGAPPAEAVPLRVSGVSPDEVRAWRMGDHVYLRTRYTLISPEWTSSVSEEGTSIYALPNTPIVLLSADDHTVSARLSE